MYAVIQTGGRQLRVAVGDVVHVDRLQGDAGESIVFDNVLLIGGKTPTVGTPQVDGAVVRGSILEQARDPKVLVRTYKRRQTSNRKSRGHRQDYTAVKIEAIEA